MYQHSLSGSAAEWAVKEQKGHLVVSERAYRSIEAVVQLNTGLNLGKNRKKVGRTPFLIGKNFGCVFLDYLGQSNDESAARISLRFSDRPQTNLSILIVRDCTTNQYHAS